MQSMAVGLLRRAALAMVAVTIGRATVDHGKLSAFGGPASKQNQTSWLGEGSSPVFGSKNEDRDFCALRTALVGVGKLSGRLS